MKTSTSVNEEVEQKFVKLWTQIAERFAKRDHRLLFESMNEIHEGYGKPGTAYCSAINHLNQRFVEVVRAASGNNAQRFLIVPGYNTDIDYSLEGFEAPKDSTASHLLLSVHFYDPYTYALEASTHAWGAGAQGIDSWGQEDYVVSQFDKLKQKFGNAGLPIFVGEYGAANQTGYEKYRRYYLEYITKAAHDSGFVPVYWDNGGQSSGADNFGLFDRNTGSVTQQDMLDAIKRAVTSDYKLSDVAKP